MQVKHSALLLSNISYCEINSCNFTSNNALDINGSSLNVNSNTNLTINNSSFESNNLLCDLYSKVIGCGGTIIL